MERGAASQTYERLTNDDFSAASFTNDDFCAASLESINMDRVRDTKQPNKNKYKRVLTADIVETNQMEVVIEGGLNVQQHREQTPGFITRKLRDIRVFVAVACWYTLTLVMVETYIMAVLTTIEKRFGFKSSSSGALMSAKEIAYVCVVTFSSHFGNKWHRPRFLSVMALLAASGAVISSLPHFLYDSPHNHVWTNSSRGYHGDEPLPCLSKNSNNETNTTGTTCGVDENRNYGAYALFQVSNVIIGIAMSPLVALTTTYVDDAAGPKNLAFYFAFLNMMRPLGPVLGFLSGGIYTSRHESLQDPGYDSSDLRWIGAWWLGYLANPALLLTAAALIAFFPKNIQREDDQDMGIEMSSRKTFKKNSKKKHNPAKDFVQSLLRLVRNPVYVCLTLGGCFSAFVISGMFPFMPKYLEVQFHMSASMANILTGMVGAMLAALGVLLGGIISSRMNLKPVQSAMFIFVTDVLFVMAVILMMLVKCPTRSYLGSASMQHLEMRDRQSLPKWNNGDRNLFYRDKKNVLKFIDTKWNCPYSQAVYNCSSTCWCPPETFEPVCGADGLSYFSPCHAGCTTLTQTKVYKGCVCVEDAGDGAASPGHCDSECRQWLLYMAVLAVGAIIGMMASVPGTTVCLRIVEDRDRSIAMGFTGTIVSLASFVPGPLLYGSLIDSACLVWEQQCGVTGSCRIYDTDKFRFILHGTTATLKGIGGIFYFLVWILIKRRKKRLMISTELTKDELSDTMSDSSDTL